MADAVHIAGIKDTEANVMANLDDMQSALLTDQGNEHVHKIGSVLYYSLVGRTWDGAALAYKNIEVNDGTFRNDAIVERYVSHRSDSDTRFEFHTDTDRVKMTVGGVDFMDAIEVAGQDILKFNPSAVDLDLLVSASGVTNAFFVQGSNGFVGIGTGSPTERVEIEASSAAAGGLALLIDNPSTATHSFSIIKLDGNNGAVRSQFYSDGLGTGPLAVPGCFFGTFTNHPIGFFINNLEKMRIDTAGNIGINIVTPDSLLHVHKASAGSVTAVANTLLTIENNTNAYISFLAPIDAKSGIFWGSAINSSRFSQIWDDNKRTMEFGTGGGTAWFRMYDATKSIMLENGTTVPSASLHIVSTTEQERLAYNASFYNSFTVGSDAHLTISQPANSIGKWTLEYVEDSDTGPAILAIHKNPGGTEDFAEIDFDVDSTTGVRRTMVKMVAESTDITNGSEDAVLKFEVIAGGTLGERMRLTPTVLLLASSISLEIDGSIDHDGTAIGFYGTVPIAKATNVPDPTGGAFVDAESRTAISAILTRLEAYGLFTA